MARRSSSGSAARGKSSATRSTRFSGVVMPDWRAYVRERLPLAGVRPAHEADVVDDLASQLEEAYREALALGATAADAETAAKAHVSDWAALARKVAESARIG